MLVLHVDKNKYLLFEWRAKLELSLNTEYFLFKSKAVMSNFSVWVLLCYSLKRTTKNCSMQSISKSISNTKQFVSSYIKVPIFGNN